MGWCINNIPSAVLKKGVDLGDCCFFPKMTIFSPQCFIICLQVARMYSRQSQPPAGETTHHHCPQILEEQDQVLVQALSTTL
jgi:hypothetical protein